MASTPHEPNLLAVARNRETDPDASDSDIEVPNRSAQMAHARSGTPGVSRLRGAARTSAIYYGNKSAADVVVVTQADEMNPPQKGERHDYHSAEQTH